MCQKMHDHALLRLVGHAVYDGQGKTGIFAEGGTRAAIRPTGMGRLPAEPVHGVRTGTGFDAGRGKTIRRRIARRGRGKADDIGLPRMNAALRNYGEVQIGCGKQFRIDAGNAGPFLQNGIHLLHLGASDSGLNVRHSIIVAAQGDIRHGPGRGGNGLRRTGRKGALQ